MSNYIINFCVDEDGIYSVGKSGLNEFGYLEYVIIDEEYNRIKLDGEKKEEILEEVEKSIDELIGDDEGEDLEEGKKYKKKMLEMLDREIVKERYELGWDRVYVYNWGVEYDGNVGVIIMKDDSLI